MHFGIEMSTSDSGGQKFKVQVHGAIKYTENSTLRAGLTALDALHRVPEFLVIVALFLEHFVD